MPSLIQMAGQTAAGAGGLGRFIGGTLFGGPLARAATGGAIGAGIGFANQDFNSPTQIAQSVIEGGIYGAGIGFALGANKVIGQKTRGLINLKRFADDKRPLSRLVPTSPISLGLGASVFMTTKTGLPIAKKAASAAWGAGVFALEHPVLAAGLVGGGIGAASLVSNSSQLTSPTMEGATLNVNYNQQAIAAERLRTSIGDVNMMGTAPQMMGEMHRRMAMSTTGLVQGMHRGRH